MLVRSVRWLFRNNKIGVQYKWGSYDWPFNGIYTVGTLGNFAISNNNGSTSTTNSMSIGDSSTTTAVCTLRGIYNWQRGHIAN
jgi:hypothetical protein